MTNFTRKTLVILTLIIAIIPTTYASDFFSHTVLMLPDNPRNETPWTQKINNQEEWESFFYATTAHITYIQSQAPTAPVLDFEQYEVLTGGLGVKPSSGYILSVENVNELDDAINIHVLDIKPGSNCITFPALSYPSTTILVKRTDKPFRFTVSQLTQDCP